MKKTLNVKPVFLKENNAALFLKLRSRVNEIVKNLEPRKKSTIILKAVLFPAFYILTYSMVLIWGNVPAVLYGGYIVLGLLIILNFLNLIHEAVHHTLFADKRLNNWYVYFFDLLGANSFIWKIRHIRLHHNYPNVMGWDSDIEQSPIARIFPEGDYEPIHRYQHIYLPFLYPFFLLNWLLIRDFKDFFKSDSIVKKVVVIPKIEFVKLFLFKLLFLFYILIVPMLVLDISFFQVFSAFLVMMFSASFLALIVLLSPHANIESAFPQPDENVHMPTSWFMHQLMCTNDIKEDNRFTRFFMGCFNYHIAHHLFPGINHVYYPEVTKAIEEFASENKLPYRKFSLFTSLKNHYTLLKRNAFHENIFEETM